MIADFAGMAPLRDALLLPDNNAQYADNCWLYRGQVRGFRKAALAYTTLYDDTTSIYRIPKDPNAPPDFTTAGSYWLEFPDPYMSVIRNPTVGDTFNRYYFFPSDQYNSSGVNPAWPATSPGPVYNTLDNIIAGTPALIIGIPAPTGGAPTVTPPPMQSILHTTAATAVGGKQLTFADTSTLRKGMLVTDETDTKVTAAVTAESAIYGTTLTFSSTTGIRVGMTAKCVNNPASIFAGSTVAAVTPTKVTINTTFVTAVTTGDQFEFHNVNQIPSGTAIDTIDDATHVTLTNAVVAAGVDLGDSIQFDTDVVETRAYVYTYVSAYGEEGPPSPSTVASGDAAGTWVVVIPAPAPADLDNRNIVNYRLYRTVTDSSGSASYYEVTEVPINLSGTTTITDSADAGTVTANKQLDSLGYSPPPPGLQGVVMMANGIAAGFTAEREVWFSAAYLPHAWPAAYALTVDYPIVGLTANGSSLNIITEGSPFIATGVTPDTMTIGKITANEPCIGRGSIVASGEGAFYASPNGIQLLNSGGTINITLTLYEKEFHYTLLPQNWASARYGSTYMAFVKGPPAGDAHNGFAIDHFEQGSNELFSYIHFPSNITNVYMDELSGQIFSLMSNGTVMQWNPPVGSPGTTHLQSWEWKTKQFRFTMPQQFKAFMVLYEVPPEVQIALGPRNNDQSQVFNAETQYLIVRVYADGRQVVVREVQKSGEVILIPDGFKAELWEFQFEGQIGMKFFKVASSVKELKAA